MGKACCYLVWTKQFRLIKSISPSEYHIPQKAVLRSNSLRILILKNNLCERKRMLGPYFIESLVSRSEIGPGYSLSQF